jgi:hypothetical protein
MTLEDQCEWAFKMLDESDYTCTVTAEDTIEALKLSVIVS